MASSFHLGRQPIVNRRGELVAYELLFRDSRRNSALITDDFQASAQVIQNTFSQIGLQEVLDGRLGFINASAELLMSDVLELLPRQQVVLEILETVRLTPALIERCIELRQQGFQLALDDVVEITDAHLALLPYLQFVKFDLPACTAESLRHALAQLKPYPVQRLAEKIDAPEQRDYCLHLGFDLFQGYYFAKPVILSGQPPSPSQTTLLKLLRLIQNDAETETLQTTFQLAPELTFGLLKLVNSVACGVRCQITSVAHAITVLGRKQLGRWIQLLIFTHQAGSRGVADPLVQTAAIRGKLMELAAHKLAPEQPGFADKAFMVGMFSLLDALFHRPLEELIEPLGLSDDIRVALLQHAGLLGAMLRHATDLEGSCPDSTDAIPDCATLQLEAMAWANKLQA